MGMHWGYGGYRVLQKLTVGIDGLTCGDSLLLEK